VTALARWLVMARRLRARPLHRAHVCVRKDAWSSPSFGGRSRRLAQEIAENTPFLAADIRGGHRA
jgi:hypothetical protein